MPNHGHGHDAAVGVDVKHRQVERRDVGPRIQKGLEPGADLHPRHQQAAVGADGSLGRTGGAAAEEHERRVLGADRHAGPGSAGVAAQQVGQPLVPGLECDTVALGLFLGQGVQQAQQRRQVLFDVGGQDAAERGVALDRFDLVVEAREHHRHLGATFLKGLLQLMPGVQGVHRHGDGARLPGTQLGDEDLGDVGQHQGDPITLFHPQRCQSGGTGVAQPLPFAIRYGRPLEKEGRVLGALAGRVADHVEQGPVGVGLQRVRHTLVIMLQPGLCLHDHTSVCVDIQPVVPSKDIIHQVDIFVKGVTNGQTNGEVPPRLTAPPNPTPCPWCPQTQKSPLALSSQTCYNLLGKDWFKGLA